MAYFDYGADLRKKHSEETYQKLKKELVEDGDKSQFFLAYEYLVNLENKLNEQTEKLVKYETFFELMKSLLPEKIINENTKTKIL